MKPRIIFLLNSIDVNKGGLTHASLRQASTFADAGYDTQILTFSYEPRFPIICQKLKKMGKVSSKVVIRNMFEDLALYGRKDKINIRKMKIDLSDYTGRYAVIQRKNYNAYRLYNNGIYEKYIALRDDDTLDFTDYFNENRYRIRRENRNYYGQVSRVQYFSFEENKVRQEVFFDKSGTAFLNFWHEPSTGKVSRITHFGSNKEVLSETTGDAVPHKLHWLKSVINEADSRVVAISDTRTTDELLVKLDHPLAKTALRPHSNHLRNPDDPDSELNKRNRYAVENIGNVDALIVLTEKQKDDIASRFGHEDKVFVIPNYYEVNVPKIRGVRSFVANVKHYSGQSGRDMSKVSVVSRFSSVKNIDHTIRAFKNVVREVPEARLEIWGSGDKKEEYADLIDSLDLGNNVLIKGYTQNPEKVYQDAALSVVTSNAEGFSLSVMESMANNTPVVSYDIRYGPSDMIEDGTNGFLIEKGDIDALSERIIHMLKNPEETRRMGSEAGRTMQTKFSKENYQDLWFSLADKLLEEGERSNIYE
ncbi:glycosyltransferase [Salinicoccus carnicancri]|uniref:glycosyltransferase n=1 Tax=Salinicoccus carnicancri TaxID=558170 RepID=UPI0002D9525C|nr:glycosyltransferase [Salinicoccus carnicancri]